MENTSKRKLLQAREILGRLMLLMEAKSQRAFAAKMNLPPSSVTDAIRRGAIPEAWLYRVAYQTGVRIEWLNTGEGPRMLSEAVAEERAIYHLNRKTVLPLLERIKALDAEERESVDLFLKLLRSQDEGVRTHLMNQLGLLARVPPPKKRALP